MEHGDVPGQNLTHCVASSAVAPCLTDGGLADALELYDPWTGAPMMVTEPMRRLAYFSTWGDYSSWTLIIASATGKTGSYRLGVRPRP